MSTTFARPIHSFHLALSPEALAQASVTPSFVIKQAGTAITPVNGQYKLAVTSDNRLVFDIEATDYFADANPVPPWVPSSWNLPGTGNYILIGLFNDGNGQVNTAQTFWAHGGNQGVSNVPQFEVPINNDGEFTIPRTTPTPLLSFDVQIHTDDDDNLFLEGVDSNNQPTSEEIYRVVPTDPNLKPYWQVFTTAAFGQRNIVQEVFKQIVIN